MSMRKPPPPRRQAVPLTPITRTVRVAQIGGDVAATPKGPKAKPGKGAPTVAEAKWMDAIVRFGCVACFVSGVEPSPAEVHHILRGGRRLGHLFTIPLCPTHHRDGPYARHPWRDRFETKFGTELGLLAMLKKRLGFFDDAEYRP